MKEREQTHTHTHSHTQTNAKRCHTHERNGTQHKNREFQNNKNELQTNGRIKQEVNKSNNSNANSGDVGGSSGCVFANRYYKGGCGAVRVRAAVETDMIDSDGEVVYTG